jgi:hypothetical protein
MLALVKLACTSAAFAGAIDRGDLTQLEFLDHAARALRCDGVVLDVRQFPRTDDDYLAQVKKMAADLGLSIAAMSDAEFLYKANVEMHRSLGLATAIGAPLLASPLAAETAFSWSAQLAKLNDATSAAKAANVTLAVRNAPGTFAASSHDCKRVAKEADSAWLRFGPEPAAFDGASDISAVVAKSVLQWRRHDEPPTFQGWEEYGGFLVLDRADGESALHEMQSAMRRWHIAQANFELNRK